VIKKLENIEPWRKIPDALIIDDALPLSAKIVWIIIGTFSPFEDPCRAGGKRIGARIGIKKSQANNLISMLIKTGWCERDFNGDLVRKIPEYAAENLRIWEANNRVKLGIENRFKKPPKKSQEVADLSDKVADLSDQSGRSELSGWPISVTEVADLSDHTYIDKGIEIKDEDKEKRYTQTRAKKTPARS